MTSKEKKIKAIVGLAVVDGRIDELKRSKYYLNGSTYYKNRLRQLEDKADNLQSIVDGDEDVENIKLTFRIPEEKILGSRREPEDIIQYLKREWLVK
jgi:hypothetical protein